MRTIVSEEENEQGEFVDKVEIGFNVIRSERSYPAVTFDQLWEQAIPLFYPYMHIVCDRG